MLNNHYQKDKKGGLEIYKTNIIEKINNLLTEILFKTLIIE